MVFALFAKDNYAIKKEVDRYIYLYAGFTGYFKGSRMEGLYTKCYIGIFYCSRKVNNSVSFAWDKNQTFIKQNINPWNYSSKEKLNKTVCAVVWHYQKHLDKVGHSCYSLKKYNAGPFFTFKYSSHHLINVFSIAETYWPAKK